MPLELADRSYLEDMLRYSRAALEFSRGRSFGDLEADLQFQMALERAIELVGEAARRVSAEARAAYPTVPWTKIVAQRNVLAHEYGEVDPALLWGLVKKHLPELVATLESVVAKASIP